VASKTAKFDHRTNLINNNHLQHCFLLTCHTYYKIARLDRPYKYTATYTAVKINYAELANSIAS
jgi:hypothetical protein